MPLYQFALFMDNKGDYYKQTGYSSWALFFFTSIKDILEILTKNEPGRTDYRNDLSVSLLKMGKIYDAMGDGQKALGFYEKAHKVMEDLVRLEPDKLDFKLHLAIIYWSIICVCPQEEQLSWLKKAKYILEPMIKSGITHGQLNQLWGLVTKEL
jgi:hypothetical protein